MKDQPIIFSAPMVRALLDGRKTMTRRLLKPQTRPAIRDDGTALPVTVFQGEGERPRVAIGLCITTQEIKYAPGDRLWVREAFMPRPMLEQIARPHYRADNDRPEWRGLWKPSIHMPRKVSRLTLLVSAIKIERLQDISEDDAVAEGVYSGKDGDLGPLDISARALFADLWRKLHGPDSVDANPEVVAVSFTVHRLNIDALPSAEAA